MTWMFNWSCRSVVPTIDGFSGGLDDAPPRPIGGTQHIKPFTEEDKTRMPKRATAHGLPNGITVHFLFHQVGHIYVSRRAVEVLAELQPDGWEAIPMAITPADKRGAEHFLNENEYFLLNVYLHRNIIDLEKSTLRLDVFFPGHRLETNVYDASYNKRDVAIKSYKLGNTVIWRGDENICNGTIFFADPLKDRWCELGIPLEVFYPCTDI